MPAEGGSRSPRFSCSAKANPAGGRAVRFLGLAVPGGQDVHPTEDLVAIWRTSQATYGSRTTRRHSRFSRKEPSTAGGCVSLRRASVLGAACPRSYRRLGGELSIYRPLESPRDIRYRTQELSSCHQAHADAELLDVGVRAYFKHDPYAFEACANDAVENAGHASPSPTWRHVAPSDGGRDPYGWYPLGPDHDRIRLEWSLEAKLSGADTGVGVRDTSRLISRDSDIGSSACSLPRLT